MATRIKDVQNHVNNSGLDATKRARRQSAEQAFVESALPDVPQTKNYVFKLSDTNKLGGYTLGSICDILWEDPITKVKRIRRMRLLRGVPTFWQDEQKDLTPEYIKTNHVTIRFERGKVLIPENEKLKLEFLRLHGANIHSGNTYQTHKTTFYEWDSVKIAEEEAKMRGKRREALKVAAEQSLEKLKKHAWFLGIPFLNEFGEKKSEHELRNDYEDYADLNPERFLESINSKEMEVTYLVKKAIKEGFIEIGRTPNAAHFTNGGMICKIPPNTKPLKALVDLGLYNNEESKAFLEQLQALNLK